MRALPLAWLDERVEAGLLRKGAEGVTHAPRYLNGEALTASHLSPDVRYYLFERARISLASSSVILDDRLVVIERASGADGAAQDCAAGHLLAHDGDTVIVRFGNPGSLQKGIFLGGNGSSNYYHWMVEILAKLEFLPQLPERYRKYPLLVSEDIIRIPSLRDTLGVFARGHEVTVLSRKSVYLVGELIYINSPSTLPFNFSGNRAFRFTDAVIDKSSIDFLAGTALQAARAAQSIAEFPEKIFLCRKDGLRNYNQGEVLDQLLPRGFCKLFMEDLSFLDQVRAMRDAKVIVGPTGAAWTNLIFCRPGTKALCWMAEELGDFSPYSSIAGMAGVDMRYITYRAGVRSTRKLHFTSYRVEPAMIEEGLAALGIPAAPAGSQGHPGQ